MTIISTGNWFSMSVCILQVWTYEDGEVIFVGIGHSAPIKKAKICPNQRYIVSVSADGAILVWKFPQEPRIKWSPPCDNVLGHLSNLGEITDIGEKKGMLGDDWV